MTYTARRTRRLAATAFLAAAALVLSVLPAAGGTPTTGVWIFPHDHQEAALADTLDDTFYLADNASTWVQDSFFADSLPDSANVQVDLYNPTGTDLSSLNIFAAISDADLFTSVSFSGGDGGDVTIPASDLGGGTPFLPDGSTMDAHGVYPAFFVSYSVGDLPGGDNGLITIWVNVSGDFAGGLMVHLDYAAVDAAGTVFTGPFEADMNILENGEADEEPPCDDAGHVYRIHYDQSDPEAQELDVAFVETSLDVMQENGTSASNLTLKLLYPSDLTPTQPTEGETTGHVWLWPIGSTNNGESFSADVTVLLSKLVLDGDTFALIAQLTWTACGEEHTQSTDLILEIALGPTGDVHSAAWWQKQLESTSKGKKHAEFSDDEADGFLQSIALHSDMFTYASWQGTAPNGAADTGWLDIDSLSDALDVLKGQSGDSKKVGGLERQALALWLNVASGAIDRDTVLKGATPCDEDDSSDNDDGANDAACKDNHSKGKSAFEQRTGISALGEDFDSVGEILAYAENQSADWKDGSGASKLDLALARLLCKAVNRFWLVPV